MIVSCHMQYIQLCVTISHKIRKPVSCHMQYIQLCPLPPKNQNEIGLKVTQIIIENFIY
jgi:hypothetical protein